MKTEQNSSSETRESSEIQGQFVDLGGERFYKIANVDQMNPFFISVVSASDHWLFVSSTGSLSSGRIRPENALFPYKSVDHIHESAENTGPKTIIRLKDGNVTRAWEPFNRFHDGMYQVERNLYKNAIGDKLVFEELNHTLQLKFVYHWNSSDKFGFVRRSEITDLSGAERSIELIDGLQNLLPSGAPLQALQTRSALVDAYKWNEKVVGSSLALYTMYAKLSDRAEPAESLLATSVFSIDEEPGQILLSSSQLTAFRQGKAIEAETLTKGVRGAYLTHKNITLAANQTKAWTMVADIDQDHSDVIALQAQIALSDVEQVVMDSVAANQQELINLMSGADAWQMTADEATSVHHYANVLFNNMRGGVFENGYQLEKGDVVKTMTHANREVMAKHEAFVAALPEQFSHPELIALAKETDDAQLVRLSYEYLPLTFGRRHGDPSRPWNHYEIKLKDENGDRLLSYQGNWRDIFQNWEAIALSYPNYIFSFMAKFVNASTMDGYNPYRITKDGIDWELLEPDDPWSNIGYWGDHQIIYLLKFLELAQKYQGDELKGMLREDLFSYANVPYEICDVDGLFANPKDTVSFNDDTQAKIEELVARFGSDGKLVQGNGEVYLVNLAEKVLVPLLAKLSNLVLDGGIWLNTQRPEWNDANNAIVGNGLSMVTLYYMRRYVAFLAKLLAEESQEFEMSQEVAKWLTATTEILKSVDAVVRDKQVTDEVRGNTLRALEQAGQEYRAEIYKQNGFAGKQDVPAEVVKSLLEVSQSILDASIESNLREDGLYNAYNLIDYKQDKVSVDTLYPMLEGQVAVLSAGTLNPTQAVELLDKLFASEMYREDQRSFMLYPDRDLTNFMDKNRISNADVAANPLLNSMIEKGDTRLVKVDGDKVCHFNAAFDNAGALQATITTLKAEYTDVAEQEWTNVEALYEKVFNHKAFTGRSGTMFGYEGLGCIYWHMVSKLLLAVQENYQAALELDANSEETRKLAEYYYMVRAGIGFNKTPENYGAFPTDPYSHTPKQAGAQQPGMTGQVKEEVITRFGELGLIIDKGIIFINPTLLKRDELLTRESVFIYQNILGEKEQYNVAEQEIAFTYCQVPFIYQVVELEDAGIELNLTNGHKESIAGLNLNAEWSRSIFDRKGEIQSVRVKLPSSLFM
ncbi:hypothetical protein K5B43_000663 [Vibrio parahaemolyticus]|nr:hypothetical protein [Vibrio parahaemolyticus]